MEKLSIFKKFYGIFRLAIGHPVVRQTKGFFFVVDGKITDQPILTRSIAETACEELKKRGKEVFVINGHIADLKEGNFNIKWYKDGVPLNIW